MTIKFHLCIEFYRLDTLSKKSFITSSGPNLHLQKHRNYKFSVLIKKHRLEFYDFKGLLVSRVGFEPTAA